MFGLSKCGPGNVRILPERRALHQYGKTAPPESGTAPFGPVAPLLLQHEHLLLLRLAAGLDPAQVHTGGQAARDSIVIWCRPTHAGRPNGDADLAALRVEQPQLHVLRGQGTNAICDRAAERFGQFCASTTGPSVRPPRRRRGSSRCRRTGGNNAAISCRYWFAMSASCTSTACSRCSSSPPKPTSCADRSARAVPDGFSASPPGTGRCSRPDAFDFTSERPRRR